MKMWSRGLGKIELEMNPDTCIAKKDTNTGNIVVYGRVAYPVDWQFKGTISDKDVPGIIALVVTSPSLIWLVLKNLPKAILFLFKRKVDKGIIDNVNKAFENMTRGGRG